MFIPVNSSALLQSLDRSLPRLSRDFAAAYHDHDPLVARSITPDAFDRVLSDVVALGRRDAGVGGIVQASATQSAAIRDVTPSILALVARWKPPFDADAAAWELALAATAMRGVDDAA